MEKKTPNPTDKYVGSRIRMQRLVLGMSQGKLGDTLKLSFQQVQKYEKGINRVGAGRLQQIASILRVTPAFFFEGAPAPPGQKRPGASEPFPNYVSDFLATVEGLDLVKAFVRIKNSKLRRLIVAVVEEIAPEKGS